MSRPKLPHEGKRINIWLPYESAKIAKDIDNLSEFVQQALDQAAGIMAIDIIKKAKGLSQPPPTPEQFEQWNKDHPLNKLTAKRENKWPNTQNSHSKPVLW
jgi:hypothetical protein